jgi:glycosyltransferase involved in cell wall biosynthesis
MLKQSVDVIIPSKTNDNNWPMVCRTISSLRASESLFDFNVYLVESGDYLPCGQDYSIEYDRDHFSYNRALNLGIQAVSSDWLVMANNDLYFHPNWFSEIMRVNKSNPDLVSFSPWNNYNNWHPNLFLNNDSNIIRGYRICRELAGWCIVAKRSVMQTIDLDERCSLWFSDNIYADELIKHDFNHALIASSKVDHLTSQTIDFSKYDTLVDQELYFKGKK